MLAMYLICKGDQAEGITCSRHVAFSIPHLDKLNALKSILITCWQHYNYTFFYGLAVMRILVYSGFEGCSAFKLIQFTKLAIRVQFIRFGILMRFAVSATNIYLCMCVHIYKFLSQFTVDIQFLQNHVLI